MSEVTPSQPDFPTPEEAAAYDAWFRVKVERALASTTPGIPHEQVMAEMQRILDDRRAKA